MARLPAFLLSSHPDHLPEGAVDVPFKEVNVPVVGLLHAGVAQQLRNDLDLRYRLLAKECRSACRPRCSTPAVSQAFSIVASRFL